MAEENEDIFIDPLPEYLRCPVCLCELSNPYQTSCGHRFCKECIDPIMRSRNAVCPIDRTAMDVANTFPDNAAKLQINSLKIRCTNKGCDWRGEYSDRLNHLAKCEYGLMVCELCKAQVRKDEVEEHKKSCPRRKVQCEYCTLEVPYSELNIHYDSCPDFPVKCKYGCSVTREMLTDHYNECPAAPVPCTLAPFGCQELVKRSSLPDHVLECGPRHAFKMADLVLELQAKVSELSLQVEAQRERTKILESTMYPCSGQFTWRIDDIRGKIRAANSGDSTTSVIYSPSFFSTESGYKISLCVYPAGDNAQGYLSLYFVLMKGQFDEVLQWPFQKKVVLSLLNCRSINQSLVKEIYPDPTRHYFSRPEAPKNVGYGYPKFIPLNVLLDQGSGFVENGAIFIRAFVFQ